MSTLSLQTRPPCNVPSPMVAYGPFPGVVMAGDLVSPSLLVLQMLKRCPCFQQAEVTAVTFNDIALEATLQTEPQALCVAVVTSGFSSSKVWPSVLIVTLCGGAGTHCCGDTHAGPLETWAQVPAEHHSLPGQVLQPVPSTLLLPSAQASDEPSPNQP